MMKKLFKWEFIYFYKQLKWIVVGVIMLAFVTYLFDLLKEAEPITASIHQTTWFISIVGIVALPLFTYFISITRYYRHVLKDEGYLTHTLPVSKSQIIISKTIVSYLTFILVLALSIMLAIWIKVIDLEYIKTIYESLGAQKTDFLIIMIITLLSSFSGFLVFYAALSFGFSYNKNEWLMMIVFLIIYYVIYQFLSGLILGVLLIFKPNILSNPNEMIEVFLPLGIFQALVGMAIGILCYFIARYFITKKLNLKNG